MAQFTVHFSTDNDAFADPEVKIARILRELANEIVTNGGHQRVIRPRDANGQRVGFATGLEVAEIPVVVDER